MLAGSMPGGNGDSNSSVVSESLPMDTELVNLLHPRRRTNQRALLEPDSSTRVDIVLTDSRGWVRIQCYAEACGPG